MATEELVCRRAVALVKCLLRDIFSLPMECVSTSIGGVVLRRKEGDLRVEKVRSGGG